VKRFRDMLGIKQEALAMDLGEEWTQKKISLLENKEEIDRKLMEQIADIMKVPVEAIEHFDEEQAINIISNNSFENCE
jgi:transcriptional regulator with XRE-family HTH domain